MVESHNGGRSGREEAKLITEFIHQRFKERGTLAAAEKDLGLCPSYLSAMKTRGDAKLSLLCDCARALGVSSYELIRSALRENIKVLRPIGSPPKIVRHLQEMAAAEAGLPHEQLRELDRIRYINPTKTLDILEKVSHRLSDEQRPYALGISISCYRSLLLFNDALWCFQLGIELATGKPALLAELRLRLYALLDNLGLEDEAINITKEALCLFAEVHMLGGIGESLIARGLVMLRLGDISASKKLLINSLEYGGSVRDSYRAACFNGLGACSIYEGKRAVAEKHFKEAFCSATKAANRELASKVLWSSASLFKTPREAICCLEQALELLPDYCSVDTALLSLDLAINYCKVGDVANARCLGMRLFSISEDIKFIPAIERALVEFVNYCIDEGVSERACKDLKKRISLSKEGYLSSMLSEIAS